MNLPDNLTTIGEWAFMDCTNLTNITLPDTVEAFESWRVFSGCVNLTEFTIPKNTTVISKSMFENCKNLKTVTLHDNIKRIEDYAFENYSNLRELTLPDNIEYVNSYSFENCTALTITYRGQTYLASDNKKLSADVEANNAA